MTALTFAVALATAFLCVLTDSALLGARRGASGGAESAASHDRQERERQALAVGRVIAQLVAGASFAEFLGLTRRPWPEAAALALAGAGVVAIFTEAAAREVGDALAANAAAALTPFARAVGVVFAPVVAIAARLDASLRRGLPLPETVEAAREETAEQFRQVVTSEAEVTGDERAILAGVFTLGETQVHEIMVPRVDVIAIDRDAPWSEVVDRVRSSEHSRLPVYADTIDEIVGVLYAKDLLASVLDDEPPADGWASLVRPTTFIPTTKRVDAQLRDFRTSRNHLAVVVDEYGGTAGMLTVEDVLEEIVGEIRDEHDDEEQPIEHEGNAKFWVSGRVTLDELSDAVGEDLRHDEVSTVGGLVYELLGRVPRAGERLTTRGFRLVVERVVRRQVRRVYVERLAAEVVPGGLADAAESGGAA